MNEISPNQLFEHNGTRFELLGTVRNAEGTFAISRRNPELSNDKAHVPELIPVSELADPAIKTEAEDESLAKFALILRERRVWKGVLGTEIEVPEPPTLLISTMRKILEAWGKNHHFEAHYLPKGKLYGNGRNGMEIDGTCYEFPSGFGTVHSKAFDFVDLGMTNGDVILLPGKWVLIDTTLQPKKTNTEYIDDPLSTLLARLSSDKKVHTLVPGYRYGVSYKEFRDSVVPNVADTLGLTDNVHDGSVSIDAPNLAELHMISNLHHNTLWESRGYEWTRDLLFRNENDRVTVRIRKVQDGMETDYSSIRESINDSFIGFRLMIAFNNESEHME